MAAAKRLVYEHAGKHEIIGTLKEGELPPVTIVSLPRLGKKAIPFVSLVRVTTRAAFYKEPMAPNSGRTVTFDAKQ